MQPVLFAGSIVLAAAPAFAFQAVHVVNGGSGGALQAAIDAAASGDTVLVHGGVFDTEVRIHAKSLTLLAEPALGTRVFQLTISGLAADQRCVVAGLDVRPHIDFDAIVVTDCAGSVRFQGVRSGPTASVHGAVIVRSDDVAWSGCTLSGGTQIPTTGPPIITIVYPVGRGAFVRDSHVAFYDCILSGGDGENAHFQGSSFNTVAAGTGGAALECELGSTVFAGRTSFVAGNGGLGRPLSCVGLPCGFSPTNGGDGGAALVVDASSTLAVLDVTAQGGVGGAGGAGGQCCPQTVWPDASPGAPGAAEQGSVTHFPGAGTTMSAPSIVRAGNLLPLSIQGTPGDVIFLAFSTQTRFAFDPFYSGVFLFGPSARRSSFGMIPGSGVLNVSIPVGTLPAGAQAAERYLQVLARDPVGQLRLGSPAWVTLLDPAF